MPRELKPAIGWGRERFIDVLRPRGLKPAALWDLRGQPVRKMGLIGCGVLLGLIAAGCADGIVPVGVFPYNFHVLEEGRVYRSSQPSGPQLEAIIDTYGIRTVINLRGHNPGREWYDAEAAVAEARGVKLVNHAMSAKSLPSGELLAGILESLRTAEYPILIHCSGGADRASAIAAIYRMHFLGHDRKTALDELSTEHLHFRFYAPCMDTLAEMYEPGDGWLTWYGQNADQIVCR